MYVRLHKIVFSCSGVVILFLFQIIWSFRETCKTVLLLSDFLNKLFGILEQMYLFTGMCNDRAGVPVLTLCCRPWCLSKYRPYSNKLNLNCFNCGALLFPIKGEKTFLTYKCFPTPVPSVLRAWGRGWVGGAPGLFGNALAELEGWREEALARAVLCKHGKLSSSVCP